MRLSECPVGMGGRVVRMNAAGPIGQRLMEMGLIEGVPVRVIRKAPLGDPIQIEVGEYRLSLRKAEAAEVEVEA